MAKNNLSRQLTLSKSAFITRLATGVLLINLFVAGLVGVFIYQSRVRYDDKAALETKNLSMIMEEYLEGTFAKIDLGVHSAVDEAERQIISGGIDADKMNAYLDRMLSRLPKLSALRITDENGLIKYGVKESEKNKLPAILNDRDYFKKLRDDPDSGLVFSKPLEGRILGKWAIIMGGRINKPDGSFAGIAFGVLTLEHLKKTFEAIDVGKKGVIVLRDKDLGLVVRYPEFVSNNAKTGSSLVPEELKELVAKGPITGTFRAVSLLDGIERVYTLQKIPSYSGYLLVGEAPDDYLAPWRRGSLRIVFAVFTFFLLSLFAAFRIYFNWNYRRTSVQLMADQEEKFHTIADYTHDWEYWISAEGDFIYLSPSCLEITGYDAEAFYYEKELLGKIIHPEDRLKMSEHFALTEAKKKPGSEVFRIIHMDGSIRWIDHVCMPILKEFGEFSGIRVSNRDITERKRDEAERLRLLTILESSLNEIYVFRTDDFKFDYVSRSALDNLGYTMEQMHNMTPFDLRSGFSEDDFKDIATPLVSEKKDKIIFQTDLSRSDGSVYPVEVHLQIVELEDYCRYLAILFDITERRQMKTAIEEKVSQLEETLAKVKQLEGIIPICMYCKKIRDDKKSWQQLEAYITSHSEASFSHGICPECHASGIWNE